MTKQQDLVEFTIALLSIRGFARPSGVRHRKVRCSVALLLCLMGLGVTGYCVTGKGAYKEPVWLEQGWTRRESTEFYLKNQGSELIPYEWFVNLESAESDELLRSDEQMRALGFITQAVSQQNPHGLPVGFILDDDPATVDIKLPQFGPDFERGDFPRTEKWLGLNCASCHTAEIAYNKNVIRIDGGPAMADHESFLALLAKAMRATCDDRAKFERFRKRNSADGSVDTTRLQAELLAYTAHLERLVKVNQAKHPYGFARLDAFGAILNEITVVALSIPENRRDSDAPVSFPYLWYAPSLDYVQWNRSADNALARNVGEVLGVFGHLQLQGTPETGQFRSTVKIPSLDRLEQLIGTLKAPAWPQDILGMIDQNKAARGSKLYAQNCVTCHPKRDERGEYPMTEPNIVGKRFIRTMSVPQKVIGTDPKMVMNFVTRTAKPGILKPHLPAADQSKEEVPAGLLLKVAVGGVIRRYASENGIDQKQLVELAGGRVLYPDAAPNIPNGYIARPLHGIWATAPYLHNGSVPNLYQMLLSEDLRLKSFLVGSREFDPRHVGFVTTGTDEPSFRFETETTGGEPLPGNSNRGHSGPRHTQTKADNGEYRDFSDNERWDLIEYMKTLK